MKTWELFVVIGFFLMVIGAMLVMYGGSMIDLDEFYRISQSGGSLDDLSFMFPMLFGASVSGMGVGCLVCAYPIYKLETGKKE